MTAVPPTSAPEPYVEPYRARSPDPDRGMVSAFIAYGLLLISLFTLGLSGLLAVILAYDRKAQSGPTPASHFAFQIKLFWICFALTLAAGALCVGGVIQILTHPVSPYPSVHPQPDMQSVSLTMAQLLPAADAETWTYRLDMAPIHPRGALLQLWLGGLSLTLAALTSWIGPIFGLLRLAAGQPIGRAPARL